MLEIFGRWLFVNIVVALFDVLAAILLFLLFWFFLVLIGGMDFELGVVLRNIYFCCLVASTLSITGHTIKKHIAPALRCARKYGMPFNFGVEHFDKSERFIRFIIDEPEGYAPWDQKMFMKLVEDEEVKEAYPESVEHPDFRLRGRRIQGSFSGNGDDVLASLVKRASEPSIHIVSDPKQFLPNCSPVVADLGFIERRKYQTLDQLLQIIEDSSHFDAAKAKVVHGMVRDLRATRGTEF